MEEKKINKDVNGNQGKVFTWITGCIMYLSFIIGSRQYSLKVKVKKCRDLLQHDIKFTMQANVKTILMQEETIFMHLHLTGKQEAIHRQCGFKYFLEEQTVLTPWMVVTKLKCNGISKFVWYGKENVGKIYSVSFCSVHALQTTVTHWEKYSVLGNG